MAVRSNDAASTKKRDITEGEMYILAVMEDVGSLENGCKYKGDISRCGRDGDRRDTKIHKIALMVNKGADVACNAHIFQNYVVRRLIKPELKGPLK